MSLFRVYAPNASTVDLVIDPVYYHLAPAGDGWFGAEVPDAEPGTDYAYSLDGGEPLPDPRSPWQPYGVHGASRVVDQNAFPWSVTSWQPPPLASAVIYEMHTGTFTPAGTFEAAIDRLGYLRELGVTHLEIMPVAEFPGSRGWGYDGVSLYAPHHAWGGPDGLKRLVDACHERGLAVLLDVVYNHLGPEGNYLARFGPYFTDRYRTPWGDAVNFDGPGSDEVRRFFIDNAIMWLRDYRFDGLRLDAVHAIHDASALHFMEELSGEIESLEAVLGRHLSLVAESDLNDPRLVRSRDAGGYGLDAQWNDDFHHALHALLSAERSGYYADFGTVGALARALTDGFVYDGVRSRFRGRRHGRSAACLKERGSRFVAFLQNHDQVGNRAMGERIDRLAGPGLCRIGAALLLASPCIPLLFEGEEWGASTPFFYFTDLGDPALGIAVTVGRREEFAAFGWKPEDIPDPQSPDTFVRSKLDWEERLCPPHAEILAWHRDLIALRRSLPALSDMRMDDVVVAFDEDARWLRMDRGAVSVACNFAPQGQAVPLCGTTGTLLLASGAGVVTREGWVELPPESVAVLGRG